jgi:hypothetical protein
MRSDVVDQGILITSKELNQCRRLYDVLKDVVVKGSGNVCKGEGGEHVGVPEGRQNNSVERKCHV